MGVLSTFVITARGIVVEGFVLGGFCPRVICPRRICPYTNLPVYLTFAAYHGHILQISHHTGNCGHWEPVLYNSQAGIGLYRHHITKEAVVTGNPCSIIARQASVYTNIASHRKQWSLGTRAL